MYRQSRFFAVMGAEIGVRGDPEQIAAFASVR